MSDYIENKAQYIFDVNFRHEMFDMTLDKQLELSQRVTALLADHMVWLQRNIDAWYQDNPDQARKAD